MGLFDAFTGAPVRAAADANKQYLLGAQDNILKANAQVGDRIDELLKGGYAGARRDLGAGYEAASDAIKAGTGSALGYLDSGATAAQQSLQDARDDLTANGGAYAPLADLAARFSRGSALYADALGVNGAPGASRARDAFATSPGYDFQLTQGLDAINRGRNARGMAHSGNTDVDALKLGLGLADQSWQQWLTNLSPYNGLELSATSGSAGGNADLGRTLAGLATTGAQLSNDAARQKAALASGEGTSLADIATRYYAGLGSLDTGEASALGGNAADWQKTGINLFTNLAPQVTRQESDAAAAEVAGSKTLLDSIFKTAELGLRAGNVGAFARRSGRNGR